MSAIGSYVVLRRSAFPACVAAAANIHKETTGKWLFKSATVVGQDAFEQAWKDAIVDEQDFEYSGYVLAYFLEAQRDLNKIPLTGDTPLENFFSTAFPFEERRTFPPFDEAALRSWCEKGYGEEADELLEPILAAHRFFEEGLNRIDQEHVVVFLIE